MFYVYILRSSIKKWRYIGITDNVERRFSEHNNGWVKKTKFFRPFNLVHIEIVVDRKEARYFEKYFKSGIGREILDEIEASLII